MFRRCLIVLSFLTVLSLLAAAQSAPSHQWRQIARLRPGSQLLVRKVDARYPQPCTLAWINNTALACDIFVPTAGSRRVVYPIASVAMVTQQARYNEGNPDNHLRAVYVGMGIGGLAGGILASTGGVRAGFAGAALGSLAGGGMAISVTNGFNPRPQPQFSLRVPLRAPRIPTSLHHF